MDVILRIGTAGRLIDFGIASARAKRSAVMAQRFRVYQRHGYYRPGLKADRDEYDQGAVSFLARVEGGDGSGGRDRYRPGTPRRRLALAWAATTSSAKARASNREAARRSRRITGAAALRSA